MPNARQNIAAAALTTAGLMAAWLSLNSNAADDTKHSPLPAPAVDLPKPTTSGNLTLVVAGGCFWCTEAVFEEIDGVVDVVSGYAGDSKETAKYDLVSSGATNHAEAIKITYDPEKLSYGKVLTIFFSLHDPTTLNRQGPDSGRHYRSAIFYATDEEKRVAEAYMKQLNEAKLFADPIVTTLERLTPGGFYDAEEYHQNYASCNPNQGYIRSVALPKVEKVRKLFKEDLKEADGASSSPAGATTRP